METGKKAPLEIEGVESNAIYPVGQSASYNGDRKARPTVSVIIPTLNEAKNLPLVLPYLPMNFVDEVILVDGRSTDNTVDVARQLLPSIHIIMEKKKGKGAAMKAGYNAAKGDILIVLDADGSNDPREIPRFIMALIEGADFVKGSRFAPGGGTTDMPRIRKLGNGGFVVMSNILFGVKFTDLCYGFHAFWKHCLNEIDIDSFDGFEIDTAIYLQAIRARLKIVEVPSFEGYRFYGVGKLQTIPDGFRVLRTIAYQWLGHISGKEPELHLGFRGVEKSPSEIGEPDMMSSEAQTLQLNLQLLQLLSMMMLAEVDLRFVLQRVLQLTLQTLNAVSGSLVLLDDNGEVREGCLAYDGKVLVDYSAAWNEILQQGLAGWVIKNRQAAIIDNTHEDPRWLQQKWEDKVKDSRSAVALPLMMSEKVVGVLTLTRPQARQFTKDELSLLQRMAMSA